VAVFKAQRTRNRLLILCLASVIFVLVAHGFCMCFLVYSHQVNWAKRRDKTLLDTREIRFAPQGMLLFVRSDCEIVKVLRQCETPFFVSIFRPFSPFKEPRWKTSKVSDGDSIVLVEYPFRPGTEWYLELFSSDNHWISMSPYFPEEPDLSVAEWENLWSKEPLNGNSAAHFLIE